MTEEKKFNRSILLSAAVLIGLFAPGLQAGIIRVDVDSTTNGPGTSSWSNAWNNLQDALDYAAFLGGPQDIWVADGTFYPSLETIPNTPESVTFTMVLGVKIFGGFQGISRSGGGETSLSQRDPEQNRTIMSGELGNPVNIFDNAWYIVTADGTSIDAGSCLNGVTIQEAGISGLLIVNGATPLIIRTTFTQNGTLSVPAQLSGPAVRIPYSGEAEPTTDGPVFLDCTFSYNVGGSHQRGTIFLEEPVGLVLVNCLAYGNSNHSASFLWAQNCTKLLMVNCTVTGNDAPSEPNAAIYFYGEDCSIVNSIVWGNMNDNGEDEDAQVEIGNASGTLDIRKCDIEGLSTYAGNNNVDVDPLFSNPGHEDFSLQYASELLNNGDSNDVPPDTFDVDDDGNTSEPLPDRSMADRQVNPVDCVDIGAFENRVAGTCDGDITDSGNGGPDGVIDVNDMNLVLAAWGSPGGVADCAPASCGDGVVNVNDLLLVMNNWGSCSSMLMEGPGPLTAEQAVAILFDQLTEHPEWEDAIGESISYILENGL
jgi:hypothetical protein